MVILDSSMVLPVRVQTLHPSSRAKHWGQRSAKSMMNAIAGQSGSRVKAGSYLTRGKDIHLYSLFALIARLLFKDIWVLKQRTVGPCHVVCCGGESKEKWVDVDLPFDDDNWSRSLSQNELRRIVRILGESHLHMIVRDI